MRALFYLEWCYARHNTAAILRSPARLLVWVVYLFSLLLFGVARSLGARAHASQGPLGIAHATATSAGGVLLLFCGLAVAIAAGGRVVTFRSPAEAVLMSSAGLRPVTIALWLQLRRIASSWTRTLGGLLYAYFVFVPAHAGPVATLRSFLATVFVVGIPLAAGLPAFLLARGSAKGIVRAFGWALTALGFLYAVAGSSGSRVLQPVIGFTHFDPAWLARMTLSAGPLAFVLPPCVFAVFVAVVVWRGNDALPEMYGAYGIALERGRRAKQGLPGRSVTTGRALAAARVPAGAGALVWKDWVGLRRNRDGFRFWLLGGLVWIACGAGSAVATIQLGDPSALATFISLGALVLVFWAPFRAAVGLADELTKPLFWLSESSLRDQITAWTLARSWRGGVNLGFGAGAAALVLGHFGLAALCVPFAVVAYCSLNALGVGLYAVFPNPLEARGPVALLRVAASFAYLVPPALLATVAAIAHAGPIGAAAVFAVGLGLQGWLVIELVAVRFTEFGGTLRTISRAT